MATFYTAQATTQNTGELKSRVDGNLASGDIRYAEFTYTFDGTEAASGDTIEIGDIPVGSVVIPELSKIANEASMGGSALAITKIGDASDDDRYSATSISVNSSTAGVTNVTPAVGASVIPRFVVTSATKRLVATFTRTNAATAGKKIAFIIAYRIGG
jgi:hypothetical protein